MTIDLQVWHLEENLPRTHSKEGDSRCDVQLSQPLPLPALRRFKRSFAKLINGTLGGRGQVPTGAAAEGMFASFVAKNASVQGATR